MKCEGCITGKDMTIYLSHIKQVLSALFNRGDCTCMLIKIKYEGKGKFGRLQVKPLVSAVFSSTKELNP